MDVRVGDIVAFKLTSSGAKILSFIIGIFEPEWRKRKQKYWHLAVVSEVLEDQNAVKLIEAVAQGTSENFYQINDLLQRASVFHWFDRPITKHRIKHFKEIYLGRPYDIFGAYLLTIVSYLTKKYLHLPFRLVDTFFQCWELVGSFARFNGNPFQLEWEYPMIHTIIKRLEEYRDEDFNGDDDMEGLKR